MELLRILIAISAGLCLLHEVIAGCEQDLKKQQAYNNCFNGYVTYVSNAAKSIDQTDPKAMANIMCSAEGKAAMQCLLVYLGQCPDLAKSSDPSTAGIFAGFSGINQVGGLEGYCNMMGPCAPVQQCLSGKRMDSPKWPMFASTPFSIIPSLVWMTCGPLRDMLGCFKDVGDKCKTSEDNIKGMFDFGKEQGGLPAGTTMPEYEDLKMFAKNECPTLPNDFSTNTCVNNSLSSDMFVKCIENVTMTYPQKNNMYTCPAYQAGYNCIKMEVGAKCGWVYSNAFVKVTPLYLAGAPTNCKLELVSSASRLVAMFSLTNLLFILLALRI